MAWPPDDFGAPAPKQAEAIIAEGKADMVALDALLDPHWGWRAAHVLGAEVARPKQSL